MDVSVVLGFITTAGAALTSAVVYLFKLYYVDTKQALAECKETHKSTKIEWEGRLASEREECKTEIAKHVEVINTFQAKVDDLHKQLLQINRECNNCKGTK